VGKKGESQEKNGIRKATGRCFNGTRNVRGEDRRSKRKNTQDRGVMKSGRQGSYKHLNLEGKMCHSKKRHDPSSSRDKTRITTKRARKRKPSGKHRGGRRSNAYSATHRNKEWVMERLKTKKVWDTHQGWEEHPATSVSKAFRGSAGRNEGGEGVGETHAPRRALMRE